MITRRTFCIGSTCSCLTGLSCVPSLARANVGCRLVRSRSGGGLPNFISISKEKRFSSKYRKEISRLNRAFGVKCAFGFYNDRGSPNALATAYSYKAKYPDGTVLFGLALFDELLSLGGNKAFLFIVATLAHEWGHIRQYTNGSIGDWVVRDELSADYLAGWYFRKRRLNSSKTLSAISESFAQIGDNEFTHPDHHGTPKQRSQMFHFGARSELLNLKKAIRDSYDPFGR